MSNYTDKQLWDSLSATKIGIMYAGSTFIITIALRLKYKFTENTQNKTAETDGITTYIDPNFWMSLSPDDRVFIMLHEAWHVALMHPIRGYNLHKEAYGYAIDYVVNQLLVDSGIPMVAPPNQGVQHDRFRGMSTIEVYNELMKNPPPESDKNNKMLGDVVGPLEGTTQDQIEEQVTNTIIAATQQAKMASEQEYGAIPGEVLVELDKLINPVLPWEILLDNFMTSKIKDDYAWTKPNKRFMPDFYLPSQHSDALTNITVAIDTSGSVSKEDLTAMLSEINYINEKFKPEKLTIIDCDTDIHHVHEINPGDDAIGLEFSGRGGTAFEPVIEYCKKNPTTVLLYFTDLWANEITEEQDYPILWLCYSDHDPAPVGDTIYYTTINN